jgi:nitrous oxide reductase accessory protein NosL
MTRSGGLDMLSNLRIIIIVICLTLYVSGISHSQEYSRPSRKDKCPVCGMFVYKYPKWVAEIVFTDGTYAVFDGPKDMFRYYFSLSEYNKSKKKNDIAGMYVTEYYTTRVMRAEDVLYVIGSDV